VAKVGTSKAGGIISQQAAVHPWLAADAHGNKQTNKQTSLFSTYKKIELGFEFLSHFQGFHLTLPRNYEEFLILWV
jgi:hypothetical protein